jgi:hypothetical protein
MMLNLLPKLNNFFPDFFFIRCHNLAPTRDYLLIFFWEYVLTSIKFETG